MRLLACLIVAPQRGYDEPAILSYAISSFCPTSADGLHEYIRNTEVFNAMLVSAGRFGVIFSVVMQVVRQYCLHEERRLRDWQDVKGLIGDFNSDLYKLPKFTPETASTPEKGANRFLQVAVSLVPYGFFARNQAGVTKHWNVPAVPNKLNPNGRAERTGANAGNSIPYAPDPDKPNQAQPMSLLERAARRRISSMGRSKPWLSKSRISSRIMKWLSAELLLRSLRRQEPPAFLRSLLPLPFCWRYC